MSDHAAEGSSLKQRVNEVIQAVRPHIQGDGGDIELVGIDDGIVKVRLQGACAACPHSAMTLKMGVERYLRERIPEIKGVENVA